MNVTNTSKVFLVIAILLIAGKASACESFEECMNPPEKTQAVLSNGPVETLSISILEQEPNYLKAIALKLDDISKKLDRGNGNTPTDIIASGLRNKKDK